MANREALRELQARLASRLQAAQTEGLSVAWLAVRVAGCNYLLPLGQSGEIFSTSHVQPVPYAQHWFLGVMNIRGGLFGVVDMAAFLVMDAGTPRAAAQSAELSVVTLNPALEVNCALQMESLLGLRGVDAFASSQGPAADAPAYFGNRFTDPAGGEWQEINLRTLSQTPQFLSISA